MKKRVLILSGPTHEYIDPVRFIGNASSGLMGKALAEEAVAFGYAVDVVTGPVAADHLPDGVTLHPVTSAEEMLSVAASVFPTVDAAIFAAAVADYAPAEKLPEKMAKSDQDLILRLRPTPDIAKTLCRTKREHQIAIGFALQTSDGEMNARRKLASKNLDGIVLNTPASLGASSGTFSFLSNTAPSFSHWGSLGKHDCARKIFQQIDALSPEK